jgi:protein-disulfide isomerase
VSDTAVRLLVVVAVVVVAAVVARVVAAFRSPPHPQVTVGEVGDRPGVVLFTSTTCPTCKDAIAALEGFGVSFREVTNDLEPQRFDTWGVTAVPLAVFVDADGMVTSTISGVPRKRAVRRALRSADIAT